MGEISLKTEKRKKGILTFAISSILITMFLFLIDEGFYNFKWMADPGNWVAFIIYSVPMFLIQLGIYNLALNHYRGPGKSFISVTAGTALSLLLVISILSS